MYLICPPKHMKEFKIIFVTQNTLRQEWQERVLGRKLRNIARKIVENM